MIDNTQDPSQAAAMLAALSAGPGTATNAPVAVSMQDRFLKLLVMQMKNQGSLNPAGNAQGASQVAQLGTVNDNDKLNVALQALCDSMRRSSSANPNPDSAIGHSLAQHNLWEPQPTEGRAHEKDGKEPE